MNLGHWGSHVFVSPGRARVALTTLRGVTTSFGIHKWRFYEDLAEPDPDGLPHPPSLSILQMNPVRMSECPPIFHSKIQCSTKVGFPRLHEFAQCQEEAKFCQALHEVP